MKETEEAVTKGNRSTRECPPKASAVSMGIEVDPRFLKRGGQETCR